MAIEELGPTFIKFGQALSTRSYLLPPDYAVELAKLQDMVRPFPFEEVEATIACDLGQSPASLFEEFDREPFASASIAQVHKAVLRGGDRVCVKVQRPAVRETLELDIMILGDLARLLETHVPEARQYDPVGIVREFERTSRREVDFTLEATSMTVFARNFADDLTVRIPFVHKQYCSCRVLTTEFIDGIKISEVERLRVAGLDTASIARIGARAVLKQVFEYGLFHADPHPGNLFVTSDGKIAPVDFGIVGRLTKDEVSDLAELMIGIVEGDSESLLAVMERLQMLPDDVRRRDVVEEIMLLSEKYGSLKLGELNFKELFSELVSFMRRYRIRMRTEFLLLGKALSIYEEVGRVLDPEFSMMEEAKPYVAKLARRRHILSALMGKRGRAIADAVSRLSSVPSDLAHVLSLAREGKLKIEFEHVGLEKITGEIEKASNRLAFSLLVAALIVGASLVLVLGRGIAIYRAFGIGSFAFAAVVGIWLLISILRSGKV
jgi:ubiquinone biosynthesis protein